MAHKILCVDDNEANRYLVGMILRRAGFEIREAAFGAEALEIVEREKPDLIILDVKLPDMDGFEIARKIKSRPASTLIPIIHLSASFLDNDAKVMGLESGGDAYLVHPVEASVLLATINALLRAQRAESERRTMFEQMQDLLVREQDARKEAENANRAKDEFLAIISHELRTPLSAILGWARMLRQGALDQDKVQHALETIERNARSQSQLIEDILDVSRIIAGKLSLDLIDVDIAVVIRSAVDSLRPAAEAKQINLTVDVPWNEVVVKADPYRLQQVIWNLLSNAIKFTPESGSVEIVLLTNDGTAEVRIKDTGKGIDPQFLPFIFERFRQADSSITRTHGGLGLGLAIVKHIVQLHGGAVTAHSDGDGRGSVFSLSLPIQTSAQPAAHSYTANEPEVSIDLSGLRCLVVEDEPDARELIGFILESSHAEVRLADSAGEALKIFQEWKPDVLVSDIGMADQDGYELIEQIRKLPQEKGGNVPALALTAYAGELDRKRAIQAGFNSHFTKPADPSALRAAVARIAGLKTVANPRS